MMITLKYFLSFFYITHISFCQIGLLDFSKVFLLHPKMAQYHFGLNTFYKQETTMQNRMIIGTKLQNKNNQFIKSFERQKRTISKSYQLQKSQINKNLKAVKNKVNKDEYFTYLQKLQDLKASFIKKKNKLQKSIQKQRAKLIKKYFVSSKKRNKTFLSISKEIKTKLNLLRKKTQIDNIFQGSDKLKLPISTINYDDLPLSQLPFITIDNFFIAFINDSKTINQLINRHKHDTSISAEQFVNQEDKESLNYYLSTHLITSPFPPFTGDTINLSYQVLELIYHDYSIPLFKLSNSYPKN
ncbi:MAG: hypothetical protein COB02_10570 [Candidatus Cloacimonadota bacterium]|nr:MAG: hypothetical protein COB02_10570 [Candidatus Cloacimonadota bacterium]